MEYYNNKKLIKRVALFSKLLYPKHNFLNHILPAVKIGKELAKELRADSLIVESASYLHDIGRIIYRYKNHEKRGSLISKVMLPLFGFSQNQVDEICYCILVHDATVSSEFKTLEAEIVANADALSQFENFLYMFSIYYSTHGKDIEKTKDWLKNKYERTWQTKLTLNIAKERVNDEYETIKKYLIPQE